MHLLPEVECGPKARPVLKELHAPTFVAATLVMDRELSVLRLREGEPVQPILDKMRDLYANLPQNQSLWSLEWVRVKILEENFRRRQLRGRDDGSSGYGMQGGKRDRGRGFCGAGRCGKKDDNSNNQQGGPAAAISKVCSASGHALKVAGAGRAALKGAYGKSLMLHDVLLVPDLKANLSSLCKLAKARVSTSTDRARTYKGQLGNWVIWDLHESKDV
ncbi:unnamed protein product [Closterium sp. NIES-53]